MKKIISVFAVVLIFTACKSDKPGVDKRNASMLQDTSSIYNNSYSTDKNNNEIQTGETVGSAIGSENIHKRTEGNKTVPNSDASSTNQITTTSTAPVPVTAKKKGWSHKAKGTLVGAGTGAITGAIINKNNRGVGALIGGLAGAASGYIIGNEVDQKKERDNKK